MPYYHAPRICITFYALHKGATGMTETTSTEQGFAEVNGARLYYEAAGEGHPLVMLHGHLLDSGQWDEQFALFARRYRVVRYDARGFGQSSKPPDPFAHHEDLRAIMAFF